MATIDRDDLTVDSGSGRRAVDILRNKVALVTGGSRGIGRAAVLALAKAGAHVCINYQTSAESAQSVSMSAREFGVNAQAYRADVARADEAEAMVEKIKKDFGGVDILINNAGIARDKS